MKDIDKKMYKWASDLFPINRSIMGQGVRDTLHYIKDFFSNLEIKEIKTGTKIFDWEIPNEWNIQEAYIEDENNIKIIDFNINNLHVVGYSTPVDCWLELEDLQPHLYSSEKQPNSIPYITSYFKPRWGFCLTHNQRCNLKNGKYHVVIKSQLNPGVLNYGELLIKGKSSKEILLSTYVCHPSMANNETSGPVVTMALIKFIYKTIDRRYSYRIIFIPETIGAIGYLSINHKIMKQNTIAGFVLTCVGDNRAFSFMPSRLGFTLADKIANHVIANFYSETKKYSFLERGSDERQFCNPLIDLPVVSLMRSKYGTYPEYHTSDDNLDLISPEGLNGGFEINRMCLEALEINFNYINTIMCEPKMDKRGLRDTLGAPKSLSNDIVNLMNFLMYADGSDLLTISERIGLNIFDCNKIAKILVDQKLIKRL
jgi:aminopeptidase-like protein